MSAVFFSAVKATVRHVVFMGHGQAEVVFDCASGETTVWHVSADAGKLWADVIGETVELKAFSPAWTHDDVPPTAPEPELRP